MEEDIKRIKEFIHETAIYYIGMPSALTNILNELDRLQKENEELKENYKVLENAYMIDSIPKSVIQDKIEELGNMTLITVRQREEVSYAIGVLQKLLNKEE